ncbi:unannotated protein [freshwater metagenome]|jgi:glycerol uptake facilitator-like aquaporin|uniref:Unannotated protein n=1 Tax=freshwater metagenome TaxID=449393 RepID=A0A6J6VU33_9ZZZZ|nr:antitoxin [Actinomycetota bacterium]MSV86341.1 antitoxin [Actinomycetota bacterium]MSW68020.1 antitoxin [Actinomycetota bacterium]MSX27912.1 antitoxin [Actinomycetota bacterium]MSY03504.1 antitoxin [Actinomycetota bacterium]
MKRSVFFAELIGTMVLSASILGSGMMATGITDNGGVQLIIVMLGTVLALGLLIATLGPISGAHFNPAVSLISFLTKEIKAGVAALMVLTQVVGAILGAIIANLMYGHSALESASHERTGSALFFSEIIATAGLLFVILAMSNVGKSSGHFWAVPAWIGSAYFFTSSTTFANPAVTFARAFSDSYAGIALSSVGLFVIAQLIGALVGLGASKLVLKK